MSDTHASPRSGRLSLASTLAVAALAAALPAAAQTVVFDQGPSTGTFVNCWNNKVGAQVFADSATLSSPTRIVAIDIFNCTPPASGTVHVEVLSDSGGLPGSVLFSEDRAPDSWTLDASGRYKIRVALAGIFDAQPGVTYWYSVQGNLDLGSFDQASVATPGDGHMAQNSGSGWVQTSGIGDMMFQLEADAQPVPALGAAGMLALAAALALAGAVALRRAG